MKNTLPVIIIVAVIAGITIYSQTNKKDQVSPREEAMMMEDSHSDVMEKDDAMMMDSKGESMEKIEKDDTMMMEDSQPTAMENKVGSYVEYEDINIASLEGKIVLDFYAPWCPSCRSLEKDILASTSDIPANLTIVKVDYDSNKDLRSQYGVRSQHTLVEIDNTGKKINLWQGGNTLESIIAKLS